MSRLTVEQIKQLLETRNEISSELLQLIEQDPRTTVRRLYLKYKRWKEKEEREKIRLQELYAYEKEPFFHNKLVAGVDEAGRGPLAGPVYAAAVILPSNSYLKDLNDSKKLSQSKREELAAQIKEISLAWSIAAASVKEIDELNILKAAHLAMYRALKKLSIKPDYVLVDGNNFPPCEFQVQTVVGGDSKCACIAAASILAKVERDRIMGQYAKKFPLYGFEKNKGYGTKEHLLAIQTWGPCELHRKTFLKNFFHIVPRVE